MGVNIYYLELIFISINFYQQQKLMKKVILTEKKNLGCKFIIINTSNAKNGYDLDYEADNINSKIKK